MVGTRGNRPFGAGFSPGKFFAPSLPPELVSAGPFAHLSPSPDALLLLPYGDGGLLDELNRLNIEFISFREQIDTGDPLGRAIVVIIGAIAELERNLIIERVRAGMRRARLEGRPIGRKPIELDHIAILRDRQRGQSLGQLAKSYRVSSTTIHRVLREHAPTTTLEKSA